jgi:hypothetical protein
LHSKFIFREVAFAHCNEFDWQSSVSQDHLFKKSFSSGNKDKLKIHGFALLSNEQIQGNILEQNNDLKPPMSQMKNHCNKKENRTAQHSTAPSSVIGELKSSANALMQTKIHCK